MDQLGKCSNSLQENKLVELQNKFSTLSQQKIAIETRLLESEAQTKNLTSQLQMSSDNKELLVAQKVRLDGQITQLSALKADQHATFDKELADYKRRVEELDSRMKDSQKKFQEQCSISFQKTMAENKLKTELGDKTAQVTALEKQVSDLKSLLSESQNSYSSLQSSSTQEMAQLLSQVQNLQDSEKVLKSQLASLQSQIGTLQETVGQEQRQKSHYMLKVNEHIQLQSAFEKQAQEFTFEIKRLTDVESYNKIELQNRLREVQEAEKAQKLFEKEKKNQDMTLVRLQADNESLQKQLSQNFELRKSQLTVSQARLTPDQAKEKNRKLEELISYQYQVKETLEKQLKDNQQAYNAYQKQASEVERLLKQNQDLSLKLHHEITAKTKYKQDYEKLLDETFKLRKMKDQMYIQKEEYRKNILCVKQTLEQLDLFERVKAKSESNNIDGEIDYKNQHLTEENIQKTHEIDKLFLKMQDYESELESQKTKVNSLETENQGLKASLNNFESGYADSSSQNSNLSKLHASLYQDLFKSMQKQSEQKQIEINAALKERDEFKLKAAFASETEAASKVLKTQLVSLQQQLQVAQQHAESEISTQLQKIRSLENQLQTQTLEARNLLKTQNQTQQSVSQLQDQLRYLQERLKAQETENRQLLEASQKKDEQQDKVLNQQDSLSSLERTIQTLNEQNQELLTKTFELKEKLIQLDVKENTTSTVLRLVQSELSQEKKASQHLKELLRKVKDKSLEHEDVVANSQVSLQSVLHENKELREKLQGLKAGLDAQNDEKQLMIESLHNTLELVQQKMNEKASEFDSKFRQQVEAAAKKQKTLQDELFKSEIERVQLQEKTQQLQTQVGQLLKEKENIDFATKLAETDLHKLEGQNAQMEVEKHQEKSRVVEINRRVEEISNNFQAKTNECTLLSHKLAQCQETLDLTRNALQEEVDSLKNKLYILQQQRDQSPVEHSLHNSSLEQEELAKLESVNEELRRQNLDLTGKVKALFEQKLEAVEASQKAAQELKEQREDKNALQLTIQQLEQAMLEKQLILQENQKLKEQTKQQAVAISEDLSVQLLKLKTQVEEYSKENEVLRKRVEEGPNIDTTKPVNVHIARMLEILRKSQTLTSQLDSVLEMNPDLLENYKRQRL